MDEGGIARRDRPPGERTRLRGPQRVSRHRAWSSALPPTRRRSRTRP